MAGGDGGDLDERKAKRRPIMFLRALQHTLEATENSNSKLWRALHNADSTGAASEQELLLQENVELIAHLREELQTFSNNLSHIVALIDAVESQDDERIVKDKNRLLELFEAGTWRLEESDSSGYSSKHSLSDEAIGVVENGHCTQTVKQSTANLRRRACSVAIQTEQRGNDVAANDECLRCANKGHHLEQTPTNEFVRLQEQNAINNLSSERCCGESTVRCGCGRAVCVSAEDFSLLCDNNNELQTEVRTSRLFFESLIERLKTYHIEGEQKLSLLEVGMKATRNRKPIVAYSSQSSEVRSEYASSHVSGRSSRNAETTLLSPGHRSLSSLSIDSISRLKGPEFQRKKLELLNRNKALKTEIEALKDDSGTSSSEMSTLRVPTILTPSDDEDTAESDRPDILEKMVARHVEDYLSSRKTGSSPLPNVPDNSRRRQTNSNGPSPFRTINVSSWGRRKSR